jgi:RND family efflux transporter MFP subunit
MKKKIIVITIVLLLFASIGYVLSKNKKEIDQKNVTVDRTNIAVAVTVIKLEKQTIQRNLEVPATVEPSKKASISAVTSGTLTSLNIILGSKVKAGQVIGSVDTRQQQINLSDAKDALNKAQLDYQLNKELYEGNAGTGQSVKDAKRTMESARFKLSQLNQQIGDARIKAPITGIIVTKTGEIGEYVSPGATVATVVDVYNLKAVVFINEKDVYKLRLNQSANISADALEGNSFNGKVSFISPVSDENHNYRVELVVNNQSGVLKAGTYIKVNFNLGSEASVLQIPKIALVEGVKNPFVYVTKGDKAVVCKIVVGREFGENIEVLSGLSEGDEVVVSGQINLTNNSKIEKRTAIK